MQTRAPSKVPGPSTSEREPCSFPRTGHNPLGLVGHADSIHCHPIVCPGVIRRSKRFIFVAKNCCHLPLHTPVQGLRSGSHDGPEWGHGSSTCQRGMPTGDSASLGSSLPPHKMDMRSRPPHEQRVSWSLDGTGGAWPGTSRKADGGKADPEPHLLRTHSGPHAEGTTHLISSPSALPSDFLVPTSKSLLSGTLLEGNPIRGPIP